MRIRAALIWPPALYFLTGPFAVGPKLSLADIMIYSLFTDAFSNEDAVAKALASCPRLTASIEAAKVAAAKWVAERPPTPF
jgi:glutathione S-transferase